jgi:hypothetical protein
MRARAREEELFFSIAHFNTFIWLAHQREFIVLRNSFHVHFASALRHFGVVNSQERRLIVLESFVGILVRIDELDW